MKSINSNIRLIAVNRDCRPGFNIYLEFSGQREYLMSHRHNGILYNMLKDGVRLADLQRLRGNKKLSSNFYRIYGDYRGNVLDSMVFHLLNVVDGYMVEKFADEMSA